MKQEAGVLPGLSASDKALLTRLLSHPMDFPQEFRAWLKMIAQADPPRLPLSEMAGYLGLSDSVAAASAASTLDYAEHTADVSVTATTEGTANTLVTGNSITVDGTERVLVEFFSPSWTSSPAATGTITVILTDGTTVLGQVFRAKVQIGSDPWCSVTGRYRYAPAAGTYTFTAKAYVGGGTGTIRGGSGGTGAYVPMFVRVVRDS